MISKIRNILPNRIKPRERVIGTSIKIFQSKKFIFYSTYVLFEFDFSIEYTIRDALFDSSFECTRTSLYRYTAIYIIIGNF